MISKIEKKNVLIIGAGIHGITVAQELADKYNVTIVDANKKILWETSKNNHNRIHLGYHYPRSPETIQECKLGYNYYTREYSDCLVFPDFFYVISKKSKIRSDKFKTLMKAADLECVSIWPDDQFLNKKKIEDSFKVKEACINIDRFRKKAMHNIKKLKINLLLNFKIEKVNFSNKSVKLFSKNKAISVDADKIINCAYTYSNNILKVFGIKDNITKYRFEETEVAVVESKLKIPALTVMDGPYISILPYAGHKNQYLVYDVKNSVITRKSGILFKKSEKFKSNWMQMRKHGQKYYPFFNKLKYKYSLFANRPIPINNENDSRATRIIKQINKIDFYSIREGKLISAPYIATILKQILLNEE